MQSISSFKDLIERYTVPCLCQTPKIFRDVDLSTFHHSNLSLILRDWPLKWRIANRSCSELQWETKCSSRSATVSQIIDWNSIEDCENPSQSQKECQKLLSACCHKHYSCYADYMYMNDVFASQPELLSLMRWDDLGFKGKTGKESTMWIGTAGAHTLCHYDTYGYNIVIQISGSKRWVLFPPSDTNLMYPTRIPYEESSVFSEVNLGCPNLKVHPRFCEASACTVILKPGDMLYVPHHWWHYVENLELSVSVNLWLEMESDAEDRVQESITRILVGKFSQMLMLSSNDWCNPTENRESIQSTELSMGYLHDSLQEFSQTFKQNSVSPVTVSLQKDYSNHLCTATIKPLHLRNFMESNIRDSLLLAKRKTDNVAEANSENCIIDFPEFFKCLTHPDVITVISKVILSQSLEKFPSEQSMCRRDENVSGAQSVESPKSSEIKGESDYCRKRKLNNSEDDEGVKLAINLDNTSSQ